MTPIIWSDQYLNVRNPDISILDVYCFLVFVDNSRYRSQSGPMAMVGASGGQAMMRPFGSGSSDEDPYSVAGSGSSGGSSGNGRPQKSARPADRPPKLPPRDNPPAAMFGPSLWAKPANPAQKKPQKKSGGDDPYYSGLRARIPNFVKSRKKKQQEKEAAFKQERDAAASAAAAANMMAQQSTQSMYGHFPQHSRLMQTSSAGNTSNPFWWHSRLYSGENGPPTSRFPDYNNFFHTKPRTVYNLYMRGFFAP